MPRYTERFGEFDNVGANVFDLLAVLRFDGNETIGDQTAEVQRDLRAVSISCRNGAAILTCPIWLARFFERGEKFAGSRDTDGIVANGLGHLIGRKTRRFRTNNGTTAEQKRGQSTAPETVHGGKRTHAGRDCQQE